MVFFSDLKSMKISVGFFLVVAVKTLLCINFNASGFELTIQFLGFISTDRVLFSAVYKYSIIIVLLFSIPR